MSDDERKAIAAVRTLQRLGHTWRGGEEWAPPIGQAPDFERVDEFRANIQAAIDALPCGHQAIPELVACLERPPMFRATTSPGGSLREATGDRRFMPLSTNPRLDALPPNEARGLCQSSGWCDMLVACTGAQRCARRRGTVAPATPTSEGA